VRTDSDITKDIDRLVDLVRYMRAYLLDENLISTQEFEQLTGARQEEGKRLESFDALMARTGAKQSKRVIGPDGATWLMVPLVSIK
jgi:hypothetical protein